MTRKMPIVSFMPIHGSGLLSIFWKPNSNVLAVEASSGFGVGFFDDNGELIGVEFFDVAEKSDKQKLEFKKLVVTVHVKNGQVEFHDVKAKKAA